MFDLIGINVPPFTCNVSVIIFIPFFLILSINRFVKCKLAVGAATAPILVAKTV